MTAVKPPLEFYELWSGQTFHGRFFGRDVADRNAKRIAEDKLVEVEVRPITGGNPRVAYTEKRRSRG